MWLLILLLLTGQAFADSKGSAYTTVTTADSDDYFTFIKNDSSVYSNVKITEANLVTVLGGAVSSGWTLGASNVGISTTNNVGIGTNNTTGGVLVVMGGNVGIGITNPTTALDVVGTVKATSFAGDGSALTGIVSGGWTDNGTTVSPTTSTDNIGIGTTNASGTLEVVVNGSNNPLMISSIAGNNGDLLNVNSSGNIGIGTTAASRRITLYTPGTTIARLVSTGASGSGGGTGNIGIGTDDGAAISSGDKFATLSFFGSEDSIHTLGFANAISNYASQDFTTSAIGSRMDFETTANGSTTRNVRLSINQSNVGVGTTQPLSRFVVAGGVSIGGNPWLQNTAATSQLFVESNIGVGTYAPVQALDVIGTVKATGFIANGNVGISTTAPTTCGCKQYTNGLCTTVGTCS